MLGPRGLTISVIVALAVTGPGLPTRVAGATAPDDLGVTLLPRAASAAVGSEASYTVTVANAGRRMRTGIAVHPTLSGDATLVSATSDQGACRGRDVVCVLGDLPPGARAMVTVVVRPRAEGRATLRATVTTADAPSPGPATSGTLTAINPPVNLVATAFRPHVVLSWTARSRVATGFEIERAFGDAEFHRIGIARRDATTYTDRSALPGRAYRYRVRAVASTVPSAYSNELTVTVTPKGHAGHQASGRAEAHGHPKATR